MAPKTKAYCDGSCSLLFAEAEAFADKENRILELLLDKAMDVEENETELHNRKPRMRLR